MTRTLTQSGRILITAIEIIAINLPPLGPVNEPLTYPVHPAIEWGPSHCGSLLLKIILVCNLVIRKASNSTSSLSCV